MKNLIKKHSFHLGLIGIVAANLIFLLSFAGVRSLWYDDIYQLFFSWNRSFADTMRTVLSVDLNPPLWAVISHFWLKIAPYGTFFVKLPSVLFVSGGVYLCGLAGKELFGKRAGILSAFLFAVSPYVVTECAFSFRAYGLYLFASAFIIYAYARKLKEPTFGNRVLFGIGVFLVAFTHYFGALLYVFLGISDLVLAIKKKQKANFFIEYVSVAVLELFWLVPQVTTITTALSGFWPPRPNILSCLNLFSYLLHESYFIAVIFLIALAFLAVRLVKKVKRKGAETAFESESYAKAAFTLICVLMVAAIAVYCNIRPQSSVWVYRYFFCLYPMLMLLFASAMLDAFELMISRVSKKRERTVGIISVSLVAVIFLSNYAGTVIYKHSEEFEPFEQVADLIMSEDEVKDGEQVLVYSTVDCGEGFRYYLSRNNTVNTDHIRIMDNVDYVTDKEGLLKALSEYDTVYLYGEHMFTSADSTKLSELKDILSETHKGELIDRERTVYKYVKAQG